MAAHDDAGAGVFGLSMGGLSLLFDHAVSIGLQIAIPVTIAFLSGAAYKLGTHLIDRRFAKHETEKQKESKDDDA